MRTDEFKPLSAEVWLCLSPLIKNDNYLPPQVHFVRHFNDAWKDMLNNKLPVNRINDTVGAGMVNVTDSSPPLPQLWKKSVTRSRSTPRLCRTAMTAPRSTCQEGGSLGSAVAAATCPRRRCKFCGAGSTSIASTPTRQSRRSSVCLARPTFLYCRWGLEFLFSCYISVFPLVLAGGNGTCVRHYFCILVGFLIS